MALALSGFSFNEDFISTDRVKFRALLLTLYLEFEMRSPASIDGN